jgi:hypothetical protein
LLVDPVLREPLPAAADVGSDPVQARQAAWDRDVHALPLAGYALPPAQQPYLVALNGIDDPWLAQSLHLAASELAVLQAGGLALDGRGTLAIGGWLQASCGVAQVGQALAALMALAVRHPGGSRHLRLADPRTRDWLDVVLGRDAWARSLGPLRRWTWLDSCGQLTQAEAWPDAGPATALAFSADQWQQFSLAPLVHPTMALWQATLGAERAIANTTKALECVSGEVLRAQTTSKAYPGHLRNADDLITHSLLTLLYPRLHEQSAYLRWLSTDPKSETFERLRNHRATLEAAMVQPA